MLLRKSPRKKAAQDARNMEGHEKKKILVHYDGQWRDCPVFYSAWGTTDYIMARSVVLDDIEVDKLCVDSLTKCVKKATTTLKTHSLMFTGLVKGERKSLKTDAELQSWWADGDVDLRGRVQLYIDHIAPYRTSLGGQRRKRSSQP